MFDNPSITYLDGLRDIVDDRWIVDASKVSRLKDYRLVVIDCSKEHYGCNGVDHIYRNLDAAGINFILLCYDPTDHLKMPRMLYYPHWYFVGINCFGLPAEYPSSRKFLWSCQNGNPRPHRIYNFLYVKNRRLLDNSIFTMHNYEPATNDIRPDEYSLSSDMKQQWEKERHSLPPRSELERTDRLIRTPAFVDAYINLVTETTIMPKIFLSEKVWKPIAARQLFVVFGNPGTINALRTIGVDTFDDIVDHSYDSELDWEVRLEKIHESINKLKELNLEDVYVDTESRRLSNAQKCLSGKFGMQYKTDLENTVNFYLK